MSFHCNQSLGTVCAFWIIFDVFKSVLNIVPTNNILGKISDQIYMSCLALATVSTLYPLLFIFLYDGPASSPQDIRLHRNRVLKKIKEKKKDWNFPVFGVP